MHAWLSWLAVGAWMALIFFLSAQPNLRVSDEAGLDFILRKIGHIVIFGVLAVLLFEALGDRRRRRGAFAFGLTVLYAASDELHQAFVAGRGPAVTDVVIDAAGAAAAFAIWTSVRGHVESNGAPGTLAAFRAPGYGPLWLSAATAAFGHAVSVVAIGWVTLQVSDSALAVGAAFAARLIPSLLLGIPIGAFVDRVDRGRLLVVVNVVGVVPLVAAAALIGTASTSADVTLLLVLSLALGLVDTVRGLTTRPTRSTSRGRAARRTRSHWPIWAGSCWASAVRWPVALVLERAGPAGTLLLAGVATGLAAVVARAGPGSVAPTRRPAPERRRLRAGR